MAAGTPSAGVVKTSTGSVTTKQAVLTGFTLRAEADAATATIADGSGGTPVMVLSGAAGVSVSAHIPEGGIECPSGIHVTITGTTPDASIQYRVLAQ